MDVYKKLLLSEGGGIISPQQQSEQINNTVSIYIGLGGHGVDTLRRLKTKVYSEIRPDSEDNISYEHIRFIGIDTGSHSFCRDSFFERGDERLVLEEDERLNIFDDSIVKCLKHPIVIKNMPEFNWLKMEHIPFDYHGTCGVRQIGRMFMMYKSESFMNLLHENILRACAGLVNPDIRIHIISGLCGGTGSGIFLDVCYMTRAVLAKLDRERIFNSYIYGYFFLPDVSLDRVKNIKNHDYMIENGFAAMKELDYCMQLPENGGSFTQDYQGNTKIEWNQPPVDMCHLICASDVNGSIIDYDYAIDSCVSYMCSFLKKGAPRLEFDLKKMHHVILKESKRTGMNLKYCTLGSESAYIPYKEMNTYLVSELFARFASIKDNMPSNMDVEKFAIAALVRDAQNVGGIYDSLYREIRQDANGDYSQYQNDWKFVYEYGNSELIDHYTDQTAEQLKQVESNAKSLISISTQNSLIGRIRNQMNYVMHDMERGPFFAQRLISETESHNLLKIIDELIEENNIRWNQEAVSSERRFSDYEEARSDFENKRKRSLLDTDKKRFNDYEYYVMLVEQHKLTMTIYEKLDNILHKLREQIVKIHKVYYKEIADVMEKLIHTFYENQQYLIIMENNMSSSFHGCSFPIVTITDVKELLDKEIEKLNIFAIFDSLITELSEKQEEQYPFSKEETVVVKLVTDLFFESVFSGITNCTVMSILKEKYKINDDNLLAEKIYYDVIKRLELRTNPLVSFSSCNEDLEDYIFWTQREMVRENFLLLSQEYAIRKVASNWMICQWQSTDRINATVIGGNFPLAAYYKYAEYKMLYKRSSSRGLHLYESDNIPGMKISDWRKLPD